MARGKKAKTANPKVIPIWLMIYDGDPSKSYIFCSQDKVLASAEGAIRQACTDRVPNDVIDHICVDMMQRLKQLKAQPFMFIRCPEMALTIHRFELDQCNDIHKCLVHCREQADVVLRKEIDNLFVELTI